MSNTENITEATRSLIATAIEEHLADLGVPTDRGADMAFDIAATLLQNRIGFTTIDDETAIAELATMGAVTELAEQ